MSAFLKGRPSVQVWWSFGVLTITPLANLAMRTLVLCCIISTPSLVFAQDGDSVAPIIDVHLHAFDGESLQHLGRDAESYESYKQTTLDALERFNIVAVASGPAATVLEWRDEEPDRIIAGALVFNPFTLEKVFDAEQAREMNSRGDLDVIGEVAAQYHSFKPDGRELESLWALAEELDIPVGYHMGFAAPGAAYGPYPEYRASLSNPLLLEDVLAKHPNLRLYVMHAGWPFVDEMLAVLWAYPNVYVDVAALSWLDWKPDFHTYLKQLIDAGFENRIMWGSDRMAWPELIGSDVDGIATAPFLSEEQKRKILYENAAKFFRLEED